MGRAGRNAFFNPFLPLPARSQRGVEGALVRRLVVRGGPCCLMAVSRQVLLKRSCLRPHRGVWIRPGAASGSSRLLPRPGEVGTKGMRGVGTSQGEGKTSILPHSPICFILWVLVTQTDRGKAPPVPSTLAPVFAWPGKPLWHKPFTVVLVKGQGLHGS